MKLFILGASLFFTRHYYYSKYKSKDFFKYYTAEGLVSTFGRLLQQVPDKHSIPPKFIYRFGHEISQII